MMATNRPTIIAMEHIRKHLKQLGASSEDFKLFSRHIGQQKRQVAWHIRNGKPKYSGRHDY
jgi:hypothetical protein